MKKKLLLIPILLLLVGVMAFVIVSSQTVVEESFNKSYDNITRKITITNSSGIVSEIKLQTPLINIVPLGYEVIAELEFMSYEDFKKYLINSNFEFFDLNTGNSIYRQLDFKFKNSKGEWANLTSYKFQKGEKVTIGFFTEVKFLDNIEWVPTFYEVRISEWAVWTASLNVGLKLYYNLDETSGTHVEDASDQKNGTANNDTVFTGSSAGIINTDADFTGGNHYITSDSNMGITGNAVRSMSLWVKFPNTDVISGYPVIISLGDTDGTGWLFSLMLYDGTDDIYFAAQNDNFDTGFTKHTDWRHYVVTYDGTTTKVYQNDGEPASGTPGIATADDKLHLAFHHRIGNYLNVEVDEVGIWNKTLSASEITQLYNEGSGITWTEMPEYTLAINLSSPINNTNVSITAYLAGNVITVPNSINISIVNVSLMINGTTNQTNTDGTEGLYNFTFTPTGIGAGTWETYLWDIIAFGNDSIQYNSTNGSMIVNISTPPISPPNQTSTIPNFTMEYKELLDLSFNSYFDNLSIGEGGYVNISFIDFPPPEQVQSLIPTYLSNNSVSTKYFLGEHFYIINERISIGVGSYTKNRTIVISPIACNDGGCTVGNTFNITISEAQEGIEGTTNFIVSTTSWFSKIFPDADSLNLFQKLGLLFVVLLVVSVTAFIGMGAVNIEAPHNAYVVGVIDILVIIYFTTINYLSVWLLLGAIVVGIGIPLALRLKNE